MSAAAYQTHQSPVALVAQTWTTLVVSPGSGSTFISAESPWLDIHESSGTGLDSAPDNEPVQYGGSGHEQLIQVVAREAGTVALIGYNMTPETEVITKAEAALTTGDPNELAGMGGSYTTVLKRHGCLTVQTDLTGQFPMFFGADSNGIRLSTSASRLPGHGINTGYLAAQLIAPQAALLPGSSTFNGVHRVEPGRRLTYDRVPVIDSCGLDINCGGSSIEEAAEGLRYALIDGMRARATKWPIISCDFSGGHDSSSIAYTAALYAVKVQTYTDYDERYSNGDYEQVQRLLKLPASKGFNWLRRDIDRLAGIQIVRDSWQSDEPSTVLLYSDYYDATHAAASAHGADLHLTGDGGDEITSVSSLWLADITRGMDLARLWTAARDTARMHRLSPWDIIRRSLQLAGGPAKNLRKLAASLVHPHLSRAAETPPYGYQLDEPSARWFTRTARSMVAELAIQHAEGLEKGPRCDSANYIALNDLRMTATMRRHIIRRGAAAHGLSVQAPFFDDDVLRAVFSVPGHMRVESTNFKPVLRRALEGIIPPEVTERRTKGTFNRMYYDMMRIRAPAIRRLMTNSRLAELGIIEPSAVIASLNELVKGGRLPGLGFDAIVAAEAWLQSPDRQSYSGPSPLTSTAPAVVIPTKPKVPAAPTGGTSRLRLPRGLHATAFSPEQGIAMFNSKTGARYHLSAASAMVLDIVTRASSPADAATVLTDRFPRQDAKQIATFLETSLHQLLRDGLLTAEDGNVLASIIRTPDPAIQAAQTEQLMTRNPNNFGKVEILDYALATAGLGTALLLKRLPFDTLPKCVYLGRNSGWLKRPADAAATERIVAAIKSLGEFYPGRLACYEVSVAAVIANALRRRFLSLVIGAAVEPTRFHAWLEADKRAITMPDDDLPEAYQELYRY